MYYALELNYKDLSAFLKDDVARFFFHGTQKRGMCCYLGVRKSYTPTKRGSEKVKQYVFFSVEE